MADSVDVGGRALEMWIAGYNICGADTDTLETFSTPPRKRSTHFLEPMGIRGLQPGGDVVVRKVCCGADFIVVLDQRGEVLHAGKNKNGERGVDPLDPLDTSSGTTTLLQVQLVEDSPALFERAIDIAAGAHHVTAVLENGETWAWGYNEFGQCGHSEEFLRRGNTDQGQLERVRPARPHQMELTAKAELCYAGGHATFVVCGEDVYACGWNGSGMLGLGEAGPPESRPRKVEVLQGDQLAQLQVGHMHAAALLQNGTVLLWGQLRGRNADGTAGTGVCCAIPTKLELGGRARCVAAGWDTCGVVDADGLLRVWSGEDCGQKTHSDGHKEKVVDLPTAREGEFVEATALSLGCDTVFVRTSKGSWVARGKGFAGLPFGDSGETPQLTTVPHGVGEVICGSSSEFVIYLRGRDALHVATASRGVRVIATPAESNGTIEASYAAAVAWLATFALEGEEVSLAVKRYSEAIPVCSALRLLASMPVLFLASTGARNTGAPSPAARRQSAWNQSRAPWQQPAGGQQPTDGSVSPDCVPADQQFPYFFSASGPDWGKFPAKGPCFLNCPALDDAQQKAPWCATPQALSDPSTSQSEAPAFRARTLSSFRQFAELQAMADFPVEVCSTPATQRGADLDTPYCGEYYANRFACPDFAVDALVEVVPVPLPGEGGHVVSPVPDKLHLGEVAQVLQMPDPEGYVYLRISAPDVGGPSAASPWRDRYQSSCIHFKIQPSYLRRVEPLQILRWVKQFPGAWASTVKKRDFYDEDITCTRLESGEHTNRRQEKSKAAFCCLQASLSFVANRMLQAIEDSKAEWLHHFIQFTKDRLGSVALQEGIAAAHIFSLEMIDPLTNQRRETQIYSVLGSAMRAFWREQQQDRPFRTRQPSIVSSQLSTGSQLAHETPAETRLRLLAPLILHLDTFISGMRHCVEHGIVYRGVRAVLSRSHKAGEEFTFASFSSTAAKPQVAKNFASGVGTLYVLGEHSAAPISMCSMFPSEAEKILAPAAFRVLARMPEITLCVAETQSDIVIAEEILDPSEQGGCPADVHKGVDLRLEAHRSSAFLYNNLIRRFVDPKLQVLRGDDVPENFAQRLGEHEVAREEEVCPFFNHFERADDRVTLLLGRGGTGKTSVMLALAKRILDNETERLGTPIFVHCPWADGLLTETDARPLQRLNEEDPELRVGPLERALCKALAISTRAELEVLQQRPLLVLLDSLDECAVRFSDEPPTTGALLRAAPLLARGGVPADAWPKARFVISSRNMFLVEHGIQPQMLASTPVTLCALQPFNPAQREDYVSKLTRLEVDLLEAALLGRTELKVDPFRQMRCVPCSDQLAGAFRAAAHALSQAKHVLANPDAATKGQARAELDRAKARLEAVKKEAAEQCKEKTSRAITVISSEHLRKPFVLYLACSASRVLGESEVYHKAPRYAVYDAWFRLDCSARIARAPELNEVMPDAADRPERLLDAAVTLATGMYSQGHWLRWASDVGSCLKLLGAKKSEESTVDAARAVLGALPLRIECTLMDSCRVTWRHRTLQEFAVARALLRRDRTSAKVWEQALRGPLGSTPEVVEFFTEGFSLLQGEEQDELRGSLGMLPLPNAKLLLSRLPGQQQPPQWAAARPASQQRGEEQTAEAIAAQAQRERAMEACKVYVARITAALSDATPPA